jgi:hypothetical protein
MKEGFKKKAWLYLDTATKSGLEFFINGNGWLVVI